MLLSCDRLCTGRQYPLHSVEYSVLGPLRTDRLTRVPPSRSCGRGRSSRDRPNLLTMLLGRMHTLGADNGFAPSTGSLDKLYACAIVRCDKDLRILCCWNESGAAGGLPKPLVVRFSLPLSYVHQNGPTRYHVSRTDTTSHSTRYILAARQSTFPYSNPMH